jgi:hypothetical protein
MVRILKHESAYAPVGVRIQANHYQAVEAQFVAELDCQSGGRGQRRWFAPSTAKLAKSILKRIEELLAAGSGLLGQCVIYETLECG